jgi:amidohydrolase
MKWQWLEGAANESVEAVRAFRHDLHRHPELAFEEQRTAQAVLDFIGDLPEDADLKTGIGGTGIVLTLGMSRPGPCVALRADMDALPIEEASGVPWTSTIPGKMHACGHDGHTAMLAGAARILKSRTDELEGPVKFLFQPAEEGGGGGRVLVENGCLENPTVAATFGLHNNLPGPSAKIGQIAFTPGPAMAGTGTFDIEVIGKGGHAAMPHHCVDPIVVGSILVQALQTLVSRRQDPLRPGLVSVTRFIAGTAYNIIPESALIQGTFRALEDETLKHLQDGIRELSEQVSAAHGAQVKLRCDLGYPVLRNDAKAQAVFQQVVEASGFDWPVQEVPPNLGGEDFAYYGLDRPSFFYFLPACKPDDAMGTVCHDPTFDFNDDLLETGVRLHLETAVRFAGLWE